MRRGLALAGVLLTARAAGAVDSAVTVSPSRVTVEATTAPISEVLDRLARQTGMKVTYEGGVPRTLVTTRIERATPAEAVLAVLEGLGLSYALLLDPTGTRVETLLMVATGGPSSSPSRAPAPAPVPFMPEPPMLPEDAAFEEVEGLEEVPPPGQPGLPAPGEVGEVQKPAEAGAPAFPVYSPFEPQPAPIFPSPPPQPQPSPGPPRKPES